MATNRERLLQRIAELIECSELLRDQLRRYERAMVIIAERLETGAPAIVASRRTGIPTERRQVTEAIQEFEAARHQLRLALFSVGKEEGASISDVGRVLGISRQLASRLAGESDVTPG
jgi:outer membrane protein TolC